MMATRSLRGKWLGLCLGSFVWGFWVGVAWVGREMEEEELVVVVEFSGLLIDWFRPSDIA